MKMVWSDAQIEQLKALWAIGMTTLKIAGEIGCKKSSVISKSHRLGLEPRPSPIRLLPHLSAGEKLLRKRAWNQRRDAARRALRAAAQCANISHETRSNNRPTPLLAPIALPVAQLIPLAGKFYSPTQGLDLAAWNASRIAQGERPYAIRKSAERYAGRLQHMTAGFSV
jgi:hypothetical protein